MEADLREEEGRRSGGGEGGAEELRGQWKGSGGEKEGAEEGSREMESVMGRGGGRWLCGSKKDRPRSCLSACLHVLRWRPGAEALWQPGLGARGPEKAGLVPSLRQT